jgi:AcrR family transcriptional regulator
MMQAANSPTTLADADSPAARILAAARTQILAAGYSALTMDVLARELGMSKKTLYAYFSGKDAIVAAVIDDIERSMRGRIEAILDAAELSFVQKLHGLITVVGTQYAAATPSFLSDLQRFAPPLYRKIDDLRSRLLPAFIGRLLITGITEGMVRKDIDPNFAVQFQLQAANGILRPDSLERLGLSAHEAFEKAIGFFFAAVLTEAGRKDFAEHPHAPR